MNPTRRGLFALLLVTMLIAGCGAPAATPTAAPTPKPNPPTTQAASPTPAPAKVQPTPAAPAAAATKPASVATVTIGELGITADGPYYIADEKGYFRDQGITVNFVKFDTGAQMVAPLATNQIQVAGSAGITVGMYNGFKRDLPIIIAIDDSYVGPQNALLVRSDLKNTIKSAADLKGRKVAVNAEASALLYFLAKVLEPAGLTLKDVDINFVPFPDQRVAFENKAIDAGTNVEPFNALIEQTGSAFTWVTAKDVIANPPWQVSAGQYNRDWATQNPDLARRFTVAALKGMRDMISAGAGGPNRDEVIQILIKRTTVKDRALYDKMVWPEMHKNGEVDVESLQDQMSWYARNGLLESPVDLSKFIDMSYVRAAAAQLGPYTGPGGR